MKDLDFDELDRAVSSLMGNVPNAAEPAKIDDTRVLTITESLKDNRPPVFPVGEVAMPQQAPAGAEPASVAVKVSQPASPVRPAPLAARRAGRFMDVVTPSSAARKPMPSQGVSRQGVAIAPLESPVEETVAPESSEPAQPVDVDVASPPVSPEVSSQDTSEWPDPLDFNQPVEADHTEASTEEPEEQIDATEPLNSPFLADAKVEKRPLGTPAPELYVSEQSENTEMMSEPEESAPESVEEAPKIDLPEEFQGDLMAIESSVSDAQDPSPRVDTATSSPETDTAKAEKSESRAAAAVAAPSVSLAAGTGSIPQQYREEPSTSDQTTGSIYDTSSYHQPLEHPAQKKTGWLWVIWVLVLLILGAGGGALAYLYLLQ